MKDAGRVKGFDVMMSFKGYTRYEFPLHEINNEDLKYHDPKVPNLEVYNLVYENAPDSNDCKNIKAVRKFDCFYDAKNALLLSIYEESISTLDIEYKKMECSCISNGRIGHTVSTSYSWLFGNVTRSVCHKCNKVKLLHKKE